MIQLSVIGELGTERLPLLPTRKNLLQRRLHVLIHPLLKRGAHGLGHLWILCGNILQTEIHSFPSKQAKVTFSFNG
ncbi:MAG: hypothetical protein LW829_02865, partial [Luteolibacter sp.]|nr:hypothetical protein [Luteolibacter sp.]